jgi:hypothetical protein
MPRTKTQPRVAIYAHVSTDKGKQTPETQLRQLRAYAKSRGFTLVRHSPLIIRKKACRLLRIVPPPVIELCG